MKTVFFHENELTIAYDLDFIDPINYPSMGETFIFNFGHSLRHPKDSPNRKIGNSVAEGRKEAMELTVSSITLGHEGNIMLWATDAERKFKFFFEKKKDNRNFYLGGLTCLK
jgi:hypothetical protein